MRRLLAILTLIYLSAGIATAQICSVVCTASNCQTEKNIDHSEKQNHSQHCHQSPPPSSDSKPQQNSHQCLNHDLTTFFAADDSLQNFDQTASVAAFLQPFLPKLIVSTYTQSKLKVSQLRSPPRIPQKTILRV